MNRAAAAALTSAILGIAACGSQIQHQSHRGVNASPSPINANRAAETLETSPTLAKRYAENAVGACLQDAWSNAGYGNAFDQYAGNGVVEFSTGTPASPTGSTQARTLISVRVYANGTVSDTAALDHWGCHPFTGTPRNTPPPANPSPPPGLQQDGPLEVGCKMTGTAGYTSYSGVVTFWNPGSAPQSISEFVINWGSNGVLLSQATINVSADIPPETVYTDTVAAPGSATSCGLAGWNP